MNYNLKHNYVERHVKSFLTIQTVHTPYFIADNNQGRHVNVADLSR